MKDLLKIYEARKKEIKERLSYFKDIHKKGNKRLFEELCFCILTPQAKAVVCDRAVKDMKKRGLLFTGTHKEIRTCLKGVRFPNNKAKYIIEARNFLTNGKGSPDIKTKMDLKDLKNTRHWLVKNIKGISYKEASHFLRNIGLGRDFAILDRHILRNLKECGVIDDIPAFLSKREYLNIEEKMKDFFRKLGISLDELDLLFWSKETGFVFK